MEPVISHSELLSETVVTVVRFETKNDSDIPTAPATANRIVPASEEAVPAICG